MGLATRAHGAAYAIARRRMLDGLSAAGVRDARVLAAMAAVPRHLLVPEALAHRAYQDCALPIGEAQTISAPSTVAAMSEALELAGEERVLEVGTGSAYQAAVLARLAARVVSLERVPRLATRARSALDRMGVANVVVHLGDGTRGWEKEAPYDAIVVTAGGPQVPAPLLEQLAPGGRLVGPFGPRGTQQLLRFRRTRGGFSREALGPARFVDLIGDHGFSR